jgi:Skp family chaperone for outer membrane proteins
MIEHRLSDFQQGRASDMHMLTRAAIGLIAVGLLSVTFGCSKKPGEPAASGPLKILVIDQQSVLRDSLAGQDVGRQAAALRDTIQKEVVAEQQAIMAADKDLEANAKLYSPAQREQKIAALQARQRAYPAFEQRKQQVLQLSVQKASDQIAAALRPVLQKLIDENKATLLLDRANVMYVVAGYDVTPEAIKRLNDSVKTVKLERVNLDALPPGSARPPAGAAPANANN